MGVRGDPAPAVRRPLLPLASGAAAVAYCWVASGYPSFTWQASLAVLVPGLALLAYGMLAGPRRTHPVRPLTRRAALVWSVPALGFCGLEAVNLAFGSTREHPTLSVLLDPVLDGRLGRCAGLLGWLALGWWLVRR